MGFGSVEYMHLFIEAKKLAFEDRARFYGDPAFAKMPVRQLISKQYADSRRKLIRMDQAAPAYEPGNPELGGDTIYMTVADRQGNMVSLIQSKWVQRGDAGWPAQARPPHRPNLNRRVWWLPSHPLGCHQQSLLRRDRVTQGRPGGRILVTSRGFHGFSSNSGVGCHSSQGLTVLIVCSNVGVGRKFGCSRCARSSRRGASETRSDRSDRTPSE